MFRNFIQQVMEAEMDEELGLERCQQPKNVSPNYRNGYSQKPSTPYLAKLTSGFPKTTRGNYEPKIISKYERPKEDKILSLFAYSASQ